MTTNTLDLYGMPAEYVALADLPMEAPVNPESFEDLSAMLDALAVVKAEDKVLALAKVCQQLEAEAAMLLDRATAITARAQSRTNRVEHLKRYIKGLLEGFGLDKVKDPFVSVWLQANPPSVDVVDEAAVPDQFKRATWAGLPSRLPAELRAEASEQVLRQAILAAVKETGEVIPGIEIITDRKNLRIR